MTNIYGQRKHKQTALARQSTNECVGMWTNKPLSSLSLSPSPFLSLPLCHESIKKFFSKKETDRYREQTDGCQKGGRWGDWVKR